MGMQRSSLRRCGSTLPNSLIIKPHSSGLAAEKIRSEYDEAVFVNLHQGHVPAALQAASILAHFSHFAWYGTRLNVQGHKTSCTTTQDSIRQFMSVQMVSLIQYF